MSYTSVTSIKKLKKTFEREPCYLRKKIVRTKSWAVFTLDGDVMANYEKIYFINQLN